jgi:two-component system response regulator AtoC
MSPEVASRILIIEDEKLIRLSLRTRLEKEGYAIEEAESAARGREMLRRLRPDLILLDFRLPDGSGLDLLREVASEHPEVVVILMTAFSTVETAVEAMRLGAYMYLNKPFDMEELVLHVKKGLERTGLRREVERLRRDVQAGDGRPQVVAESAAMLGILATIERINAVGAATVLLRGENGTGKDVLAHHIHATSVRSSRPFQNITCTALPDNLLESELFGFERGAFTDAKVRKPGLLELADTGTVFLDEIGDMSPTLQAKLLRFLEERTLRRVGGTEDIHVDVRVVAATNRDLEEAVAQGRFRQDLYYRLAVIPIHVPPLRERKEDVLLLARHFIDRYNREFRRQVQGITPEAEARLLRHTWPGNVRELRNVIERAMILGRNRLLEAADLPDTVRSGPGASGVGEPQAARQGFVLPAEGIDLDQLERDLVRQALERTSFNQTHAARLLGMTRDQMRYRIEKFGLEGGKGA